MTRFGFIEHNPSGRRFAIIEVMSASYGVSDVVHNLMFALFPIGIMDTKVWLRAMHQMINEQKESSELIISIMNS